MKRSITIQYRIIKAISLFLTAFETYFYLLVFYLMPCIPLFFIILIFAHELSNYLLGLVCGWFALILFLNLHFGTQSFFNRLIEERIIHHFEKKWGLTEEQIENFISKRAILKKKSIKQILPCIYRFCKFNESARTEQQLFLSDRFYESEIFKIMNNEYSHSQIEASFLYWEKRKLSEKQYLMDLLFKLSIVEDGIRNDEWNMLMSTMTRFKFNKNYFDYFAKRYSALRTEFEEWEKRSTSTEEHKATSALKAYYATLGLEESASDEEVKKAYHALALLHHPDLPKNADRIQECEAMMTKINEAYEKIRG